MRILSLFFFIFFFASPDSNAVGYFTPPCNGLHEESTNADRVLQECVQSDSGACLVESEKYRLALQREQQCTMKNMAHLSESDFLTGLAYSALILLGGLVALFLFKRFAKTVTGKIHEEKNK